MNRNTFPRLCGTLLFAAVFFLLAGCGKTSAPATTPAAPAAAKPGAITITYVKAPLNVPSILEKKLASFDKEFAKDNIKVSYPEITVGSKQTEALAAGSLDFAHCLGGTSAILAAANGVDLKIIGMYSRAPKAFVVLVKDSAIRNVADLKGKKIAGPKGTILHQLILAALAKNGLRPDDIQFVSMDLPSSAAALMNGSVDAALSAGPDAIRAEKAGARILTNGEGLVEASIVTAVRGDFLMKQPELVKRFLTCQHLFPRDLSLTTIGFQDGAIHDLLHMGCDLPAYTVTLNKRDHGLIGNNKLVGLLGYLHGLIIIRSVHLLIAFRALPALNHSICCAL